MSRLCRLKCKSHGEDGKWAYNEIIRLRKELDESRAASHAREAKLRGQILKMIDRWWPFVHASFPRASDAARALYKEA